MLVLTRRPREQITLSFADKHQPPQIYAETDSLNPIQVTVLEIKGNQVKLGIQATSGVRILRTELIN
ncbi:MAG: carbon storage regulator [Thiotrichaceae bacterium]